MKTVAEKIKNIKFRTWKKCIRESTDFDFRTHSINAVYDNNALSIIIRPSLTTQMITFMQRELENV